MDRKKDRGDDGQARAKSGLRTFEIVWDTISCLCLMLAGSAFQPRDALTLLLEAGFVDLAVTLVCLHAPVRPVPSLAAVLAVARPHHAARRAALRIAPAAPTGRFTSPGRAVRKGPGHRPRTALTARTPSGYRIREEESPR